MKNEKITLQSNTVSEFSDLLYPKDDNNFFSKYWEKQPLVIRRDNPDYYSGLFSIKDVDVVLALNQFKSPDIRVVKNQEPLLPSKYENPDGTLKLNHLYTSYADGYTVVINELQRFWQPLRVLCQNIQNQLSHQVVANMYLTPKEQKALMPHYDTHDVIVLQVYGKKHWKVYDCTTETPLLHSFQPIFQRSQLGKPKEITLQAGDMMYMPRGYPHEAMTSDESSLHLTIGIHPDQWVDLLTNALKKMAFTDVEFRKALPPGYLNFNNLTPEVVNGMMNTFNRLINQFSKNADARGALQLLGESFRNKVILAGDGHFEQIDRMGDLQLDTLVEKRQKMNARVVQNGQFSWISFPGNTIKGPAHIASALHFISASGNPFKINELPSISDKNKIKLTQRLLRGGLLKVTE